MEYDAIIGLEIHAELKTKSKMFCACDNDAEGKAPNTAVCPVCLGHPGTLPVPNRQAIDWTIQTGLALNCRINQVSKFDRKNYFYPDLPKGYQISQYDMPFCQGGYLEIGGRKIGITRIHLEEDTGKSFHHKADDYTAIDFNRAGTPLMEMVTDPVIKDATEAKEFCQAYQQILRYLKVSQADMEKGEMRCEANISLQEKGAWALQDGQIVPKSKHTLNAKVEVKNINSFRALERAINFEIKRQTEALAKGEAIKGETRGWDDNSQATVSQRSKESSADYRYFPEPDIPPIEIDQAWLEKLSASLPEMPAEKRRRFAQEYGLSPEIAATLVADPELADWTEKVISELDAWIEASGDESDRQDRKLAKTAGNWITSELLKHLRSDNQRIEDLKLTAENFAELVALVYQGKVNSSAGQAILEFMYKNGGDPTDIMKEMGLEQIDDRAALEKSVQAIIAKHPGQSEEYRQGKASLLQFFIGQVMAETRGKANPKVVAELIEKLLK